VLVEVRDFRAAGAPARGSEAIDPRSKTGGANGPEHDAVRYRAEKSTFPHTISDGIARSAA
jgi:hypothetical protein